MQQMQMHSFMLTEMFQECFISACPWVNPLPIWGHIYPWVHPHPRGGQQVLYGYLLHFAGGKFSRTEVCDIYPLAERVFNFPNLCGNF